MDKRAVVMIGVGVAVFAVLGSVLGVMYSYQMRQPVQETTTAENKLEPTTQVTGIFDIGATEPEFRKRYNRVVAENFDQYPISLSEYRPYTFNHTITYEDPFTDRLAMMVCRYADSGLVKGILLAANSVDEAEGVQTLAALTSMVAAADSLLSPRERGELLQQLGMFPQNGHTDYAHINSSVVRNGKRYFIRSNNGQGVLFGVVGQDVQLDPAAAKEDANDDHNIIIDIVNYAQWLSKQEKSTEQPSSFKSRQDGQGGGDAHISYHYDGYKMYLSSYGVTIRKGGKLFIQPDASSRRNNFIRIMTTTGVDMSKILSVEYTGQAVGPHTADEFVITGKQPGEVQLDFWPNYSDVDKAAHLTVTVSE